MRLILVLFAVLLALPAQSAQAHTSEALREWMIEWVKDADTTMIRWDEFEQMKALHPWYFNPVSPVVPHEDFQRPRRADSGMGSNSEQWRYLVAKYFDVGDVDTAMRVLKCESGGNPNADNPRSSASGLFQHLGKYWPQRSANAGWAGASIWDPEANVAVAAWLQRTAGWGSWTCY